MTTLLAVAKAARGLQMLQVPEPTDGFHTQKMMDFVLKRWTCDTKNVGFCA